MEKKDLFANPFRVFSPQVDSEVLRLHELHSRRISESVALEEGVLILISKLMEMTNLLSQALVKDSLSEFDKCKALADEVHDEEKLLTSFLVSSGITGDVLKGVIRFPYRLERIGDMLESMLNCFRIKSTEGIRFSDQAVEELKYLLDSLLAIMGRLRDAFREPDRENLEAIKAQTKDLASLVDDARTVHWDRLAQGVCLPEASSLYREILDSLLTANEYLDKMASTLIELGQTGSK